MFSGVCVFSNTGGSASRFLRNVTSGSFLEEDQLREINVPLQPHARVTPRYGELSMSSVTSCKNASAFTTQIAHSLKGRGWVGGGGAFGGI